MIRLINDLNDRIEVREQEINGNNELFDQMINLDLTLSPTFNNDLEILMDVMENWFIINTYVYYNFI